MILDLARKWLVNFDTEKVQLVKFEQSNNSSAIHVQTYRSAPEDAGIVLLF